MDRPIPFTLEAATQSVRLFLLASQVHLFYWLRRRLQDRGVRRAAWIAGGVAGAGAFLLLLGDMYPIPLGRQPSWWRFVADVWTAGAFVAYALLLSGGLLLHWRRKSAARGAPDAAPAADRIVPDPPAPERRRFVEAAALSAVAAPLAVAGYGTFIGRKRFELREVPIAIPNLPADLEGLRIAQITDIHAGPFLTRRELEVAVAMANETKPHLAVVTGDVITQEGDPLESSLDALGGLRADSGVWGCMGNHEAFAKCLQLTERYGRSRGIQFLRQGAETLRFGDALLNLSGVDYQRKNSPYLQGAERLLNPAAVNLLLSHNPDVFPVAAELGYDLVISGHTHGGQVTLEIVEQSLNAGHFFTPYVVGQYQLDRSNLYVSRGVGCVNLPMRIGAWPEITLLTLRKA